MAGTLQQEDDLTRAFALVEDSMSIEASIDELIEFAKKLPSGEHLVSDDTPIPNDTISVVQSGPTPDTSFLSPPKREGDLGFLGGYHVLRVLGVGGMGIVLEGVDERLERRAAIKVIRPEMVTQSVRERFLREAKTIASIEHDNIVSIYGVDEANGVLFFAMQYLHGETLQSRIDREGQIDQHDVVAIGRQIAAGLAVAHGRGMIHRDIKPANIWLESDSGRVKILDFGLARDVGTDSSLTMDGIVLGTPRYMSPEQCEGNPVDPRGDLFSLGAMMYFMASGVSPFVGKNVIATLMSVVGHQPDPVGVICPHLNPKLAQLISNLIEKDPDKRPTSAESLRQRFAEIEQEPETRGQASPIGHRAGVCLALMLATVGVVAVAQIVITVTRKDGSKFTATVPDDAKSVEIDLQNESSRVMPDKRSTEPEGTQKSTDFDRREFARWAIDHGYEFGYSLSSGGGQVTGKHKEIPKGDFYVTDFGMRPDATGNDADAAREAKLKHATRAGFVFGPELTEVGLKALSEIRGVKRFRFLHSQRFTERPDLAMFPVEQLHWIAKIPGVWDMIVGHPDANDETVKQFLKNPAITKLTFHTSSKITDEGARLLSQSPRMKEIGLEGSLITKEGIELLVELPHLESLGLIKCDLDDGIVDILSQKKTLRRVNLVGTKVTPEGRKRLSKALPNCVVVFAEKRDVKTMKDGKVPE